MRKLIVIILLFGLVNLSYSQNNGIKLIASPRQDSIMLRWAPNNAYTWRLANEYGYLIKRFTIVRKKKVVKDVVEIDLTDIPIKPKPLSEWKPYINDKYVSIAAGCIYNSEDDGISVGFNPHLVYQKYKEEQHRFGFALYAADQSPKAAKLSGLYFVDHTALPKEKYLYRVFVNCPDTLAVDTASDFTGISEYEPLPKPLDFTARWGDKKVDLSWNIKYLSIYYNSYFIEKSTDKGVSYHRISENNAVQISDEGVNPEYQYKSDTLQNNHDIVYYRVRGVTPFGETSPPSDSVFGKGQLPIEIPPVIINDEVINNTYIRLDWLYPEKMNDHINGFKVYCSSKPKGRKKLIYQGNDPLQRSYTDSTPSITNYYYLSVYNSQKEKLTPFHNYVQRIDSFPPNPPVNFRGIIDSTGAVHFKWSPNTEDDIDGYRIYRANNPKFEFALIHPSIIRDTQFVDSINLKVLNKKIFYRIKAIDARDNQSSFSPVLTLKRPDIIPPVPPVIKNISLDKDKHPVLLWVNSSSSDVINHHIYRKILHDSTFIQIVTVGKGDSIRAVFTDKTVTPGNTYCYYIVAEDDSKLHSQESNIGNIVIPHDKEKVLKLKRKIYTDKVKLYWDIETDKPVEKIIIYRSVDDGKMNLLGFSTGEEYLDEKITPEKNYSYSIKIEFTDGTTSFLSKPVTAKM